MRTYVEEIEPRLTQHRDVAPETVTDVLIESCKDLEQETLARLVRLSGDELRWQPHRDSNSVGVTVWHIARWLDYLGTRAFTGGPSEAECWVSRGWLERTGYDPSGIGWFGLGTLTGYTPEEMRAVPSLSAEELGQYLGQSVEALVEALPSVAKVIHRSTGAITPYQAVSSTLQGSFGHLGEIDALVSLRARLLA